MKKFTPEQVCHEVSRQIRDRSLALKPGFTGQIMIQTNFFLWSDGSYRKEPEIQSKPTNAS